MLGYDMRGTFYVDLGSVDTDEHLSWDEIRGLREAGHEIAVGVPPTLDRSRWVDAARSCKEALEREKVGGSPGICLPAEPGPEFPALPGQLAALGLRWQWGVMGPPFHSVPLAPGGHASSVAGRRLEDLKALVDRALAEGKHVDLRFHRVETGKIGRAHV